MEIKNKPEKKTKIEWLKDEYDSCINNSKICYNN